MAVKRTTGRQLLYSPLPRDERHASCLSKGFYNNDYCLILRNFRKEIKNKLKSSFQKPTIMNRPPMKLTSPTDGGAAGRANLFAGPCFSGRLIGLTPPTRGREQEGLGALDESHKPDRWMGDGMPLPHRKREQEKNVQPYESGRHKK